MDASEALIAAGFVENVFSCPACGLAGTSLARPEALVGKTCLGLRRGGRGERARPLYAVGITYIGFGSLNRRAA